MKTQGMGSSPWEFCCQGEQRHGSDGWKAGGSRQRRLFTWEKLCGLWGRSRDAGVRRGVAVALALSGGQAWPPGRGQWAAAGAWGGLGGSVCPRGGQQHLCVGFLPAPQAQVPRGSNSGHRGPFPGPLPHATPQPWQPGGVQAQGPICRWNLGAESQQAGVGLSCGLLRILSFTKTARIWFPALLIIGGSY